MYLGELESRLSETLALDRARTRSVARRMQAHGMLPRGPRGGSVFPAVRPADVVQLFVARALDLDPTTSADLARQFCALPARAIRDEIVNLANGAVLRDDGLVRIEDYRYPHGDAAIMAPMLPSLLGALCYALPQLAPGFYPQVGMSLTRSAGSPLVVLTTNTEPFTVDGITAFRRAALWYGGGERDLGEYMRAASGHSVQVYIGHGAMLSIALLVQAATEPNRPPFDAARLRPDRAAMPARESLVSEPPSPPAEVPADALARPGASGESGEPAHG
jgi:hypothetical protein